MKSVLWLMAWLMLPFAAPVFGATVEYLHTGALGSVVAVSNGAGTVIERRENEPYGRHLVPAVPEDGPAYTGHVSDAATGLSYMQQRYYDPQIGRFLSVDPVSADTVTGWNFNRYNYAANNPYKFKDPDGRIIETAWDVFNIGLGVASFASNVSDGNYGAAALDAVGVVVDSAAAAVPVLPGGVGTAIKAARVADKAADAAKGAAGSARAGKAHTRAANRLGREQNKAANGGEMKCPTCGRKMNDPVQSRKGQPVDRDAAVGDHRHPKSQGGDGATVKDMSNHETKCWQCNHDKSDRIP